MGFGCNAVYRPPVFCEEKFFPFLRCIFSKRKLVSLQRGLYFLHYQCSFADQQGCIEVAERLGKVLLIPFACLMWGQLWQLRHFLGKDRRCMSLLLLTYRKRLPSRGLQYGDLSWWLWLVLVASAYSSRFCRMLFISFGRRHMSRISIVGKIV